MEDSNQLLEFSLLQNYPNPFNNKTKISFTIPDKNNVLVRLYNSQGKLVKSHNENFNAGIHNYFWDGTDNSSNIVSSGIYYYEVISGNYSEVKKCVLIK